jgi:uracil DNA glycosylase
MEGYHRRCVIFSGNKWWLRNYFFTGSGNLGKWAKQGVLLLNASLTVRATPNSHKHLKIFYRCGNSKISDGKEQVVFLLWGNLHKKGLKIDQQTFSFRVGHHHPWVQIREMVLVISISVLQTRIWRQMVKLKLIGF